MFLVPTTHMSCLMVRLDPADPLQGRTFPTCHYIHPHYQELSGVAIGKDSLDAASTDTLMFKDTMPESMLR